MANWNDPQPNKTGFGASPSLNGKALGGTTVDQGLRRYMLSIYNYMASGILLSGVVALLFAVSGLAEQVMLTPLRWIIALAPLGFVFAMSFGVQRMKTSTLQLLFWLFSVAMGLSLSAIFLIYTGPSIATTFFATAASFAGLSLVGYTTRRDLSAMGAFMVMGLFGILAAMLLNFWLRSNGLALAISVLGVVIFAGLTAWDTQRMKNDYYRFAGTELAGKVIIMSAMQLYLDFINLFQFLLSFMGNRR
jgi:FtsH-binding integral membrane protein